MFAKFAAASALLCAALGGSALAQEPVTLQFWEGHSAQEEAATLKMVDAFQKTHPNIKVNVVKTSFGTNFEAITTALANPVTIPMILTASYELGTAILGVESAHAASSADVMRMVEHLDLPALWGPVFKPMLVGSLPLAAGGAVLSYIAAYQAARLFQKRRRARTKELGSSS